MVDTDNNSFFCLYPHNVPEYMLCLGKSFFYKDLRKTLFLTKLGVTAVCHALKTILHERERHLEVLLTYDRGVGPVLVRFLKRRLPSRFQSVATGFSVPAFSVFCWTYPLSQQRWRPPGERGYGSSLAVDLVSVHMLAEGHRPLKGARLWPSFLDTLGGSMQILNDGVSGNV